jgi:hypothetical protein
MPKTKKKAGRPRIEFDLEAVEGLGRIGATINDMVHVLPASKRTIAERMAEPEGDFRTAYEKGRSLLNSSLRRKQIQVAMTGNVAMLIWLGKQHLAQADRQDTRISVTPEEVARMSDEELTRMLEEARLQSASGRGGSGR